MGKSTGESGRNNGLTASDTKSGTITGTAPQPSFPSFTRHTGTNKFKTGTKPGPIPVTELRIKEYKN